MAATISNMEHAMSILATEYQEPLLTTAEVARMLAVSEYTVRAWRMRGTGPPYVRVAGKAIRYRADQVEAWLEERTVRPEAE